MDLKQTQLEFENLFHKNQTIDRLIKAYRLMDAEAYAEHHGLPPMFVLNLLAQMELHRRAQPSVLVGILHTHFGKKGDIEAIRACAEALAKAAAVDIVDVDPTTYDIVIRIAVPDEVRAEVDRYQFPLPMVVPPARLKTNTDTG